MCEPEFTSKVTAWLHDEEVTVRKQAGAVISKLEYAGHKLGEPDAKCIAPRSVAGTDHKKHSLWELRFDAKGCTYRIGYIWNGSVPVLLAGGKKDGVSSKGFYDGLEADCDASWKAWQREQAPPRKN